jgi:hypothetical protein
VTHSGRRWQYRPVGATVLWQSLALSTVWLQATCSRPNLRIRRYYPRFHSFTRICKTAINALFPFGSIEHRLIAISVYCGIKIRVAAAQGRYLVNLPLNSLVRSGAGTCKHERVHHQRKKKHECCCRCSHLLPPSGCSQTALTAFYVENKRSHGKPQNLFPPTCEQACGIRLDFKPLQQYSQRQAAGPCVL